MNTFLWWTVTLLWAGVIFYLSTARFGSSFSAWLLAQTLRWLHITVSPSTFSTLHFLMRKSAHVTEYAIFGLLLYRSVSHSPEFEWRARTACWCVLIAGLYSLTDEFHQLFEPGRTASLVDCAIDTTGAALAMLLLHARGRLRRRDGRSDRQQLADRLPE